MSAFLLLVGLTLFISGAAMYFAHAARNEPRWIAGSLLLPVVVPIYYRRHWDDLQLAGLLQSAGLVMALSGGLMLVYQDAQSSVPAGAPGGALFSSKRAQTHSGFVDSERALRLLSRQGPGVAVFGRLHGEVFRPDRVELIEGMLRLREGNSFVPDREVALFLGEDLPVNARIKRVLGPYNANVPEVEISWRDENGMPVTETVRQGYRLDLELAPTVRGKMAGYIQLTLPDAAESYVAGDLEVVTSHLRYRDGQVDRGFDHIDTLHFIAEDYLASQYKAGDIQEVTFGAGSLDPLEGRAETVAHVALNDGRVGSHVIKAAKTEYGWSVLGAETAAATAAAGFKPVYNVLPPSGLLEPRRVVVEPRKKKPAASAGRERVLAFAELSSLTGQGAVVEFADGRHEQGVLRGVSNDRLLVDAIKGGGVIQFRVSASELAGLRMNSGDVIRLPGKAPAAGVSANSAATAADAPPQTVKVGDLDLTRFVNKMVRVVAADGKVTVGVFRSVNKDGRLVVETAVGGGKVDYTLPAAQVASIDFASR